MASLLSLWTHIKRLNWANRITLLRIGAVLPIVVLMHFPRPLLCWIAAVLFVLASLSDFLDGYIARREGMVTTFGKFLDPLADKLLICSVLVQMVALGWVPAWVTILVIVRELAVTGLRAVAADHGVVIAADRYGKWKTVPSDCGDCPFADSLFFLGAACARRRDFYPLHRVDSHDNIGR